MDIQSKLDDLKTVAERLFIEIRHSDLDDGEFSIQSGYCKLNDKKLIILDKKLAAEEQIKIILQVFRQTDLEHIFVVPWIREQLEVSNFPKPS